MAPNECDGRPVHSDSVATRRKEGELSRQFDLGSLTSSIFGMKELTIRESEILLLLKQFHNCGEAPDSSGPVPRKRARDGARE